eukprot:CAMPEP_0113849602 /NCGR_PEP_ID=MMETSP0372-20130328/3252_1 /TAXON_ID=340204 /ORGANISM="Lankesteria abbotti" /LENGTH=133 /DNA_ID=CAMNT_0000819471 /DNA_START=545 /DNA_END=943 /DNA_ORIENTATION=+ /assembly_acc=CAM_ASM_000359
MTSTDSGCLSTKDWSKFVEKVWAGPESVVLHTVILPEGMKPDDPALRKAHIVEEKRYRLPAGVIPKISSRPCNFFEANIAPECNPKNFPVPDRFVVLSNDPTNVSRAGSHLLHPIPLESVVEKVEEEVAHEEP